jgi:ribosomal protein S10
MFFSYKLLITSALLIVFNLNLLLVNCVKLNCLSIVFSVTNTDMHLLFRECSFFLSTALKLNFRFRLSSSLLKESKIFSILRSPFVFSKSKEHLGIIHHSFFFKFDLLTGFFLYYFFLGLHSYFTKYNLISIQRILR